MTSQERKDLEARNRRHWRAHVNALRLSGLSRAEYCRQHSLSYHAMTYWWRRLSTPKESTSTLVPVSLYPHSYKPLQAASEPIRVILNTGICVEIQDSFSERTLTRLLTVLERR